jgi:hypothetical protein
MLEAMERRGRDRLVGTTPMTSPIFTLTKWLAQARERWSDPTWATTRVYLGFLQKFDTLIERKLGKDCGSCARRGASH